jgi:thiosulfate dehydrogenase
MKRILIGIILVLAIEMLTAYALVSGGVIPANADALPGQVETWLATKSLDATLARLAPTGANPVALTDQNLTDGVHLFAQNCAICHGSTKGSASPSPIAQGLYQKPPQFGSDGVEDDPEGVSFWKIKHGIRLTGMPSFGYTLSDRQIWTIALFLKHMDKLPPTAQLSWQQVRNWPILESSPTSGKPN